MGRHLLISAALLAAFQEPARVQDPKDSKLITIRAYDPETTEMYLFFTGYGQFDQNKGTGSLARLRLTYYTKATAEQQARVIEVFSNRCDLTGMEHGEASKNMVFRFSQGLRVLVDDNVRLWTAEGTLESESRILRCPGTTHLIHFPTWPHEIDLASALVFMEPVELGWLRFFGAPEPNLELVGDEFLFDAAAGAFTATRNGRIRVKGNPAKPQPGTVDPTDLRCEGPLRLRNLPPSDPDAWPTLHVTAEKNVVIERRAKDAVTRTRSDSASFYIATPPKKAQGDPRPLSAVLSGHVRIEVTGGISAAGDRVEWSHQDDLMRLTGVPRVQILQGDQKLRAREVIIDRWNRTIDFKGDIEATFQSSEGAKDLMTLTPGDLRVTTDSKGRPIAVHANNGVRLSSGGTPAGPDVLEAHGNAFEWDLITGEGLLRGVPFARIQEGFNLVVAPLVSFRGAAIDKALMTVKGPKLMRFFAELDPPRNVGIDLADAALGLPGLVRRPSEPALNSSASALEAALGLPGLQKIPGRRDSVMDFTITCDGDVVVDQQAGVVKLVDRCQVRAQDSTLDSDRLFVFLKKDNTIDRVLGSGRVVAVYSEGPTGGRLRVDGETFEMKLDPTLGPEGERVVTIVGHPIGRLQFGGQDSRFERMSFNLDNKTVGMIKGSLPLRF